MKKSFLFLLACVSIAVIALSNFSLVAIGKRDSIYSATLKEMRYYSGALAPETYVCDATEGKLKS